MALHIARYVRENSACFWQTKGSSVNDFRKEYGDGDLEGVQHVEMHSVSFTEEQELIFQALMTLSHATDCPRAIEEMLVTIFEAGYRAGAK